MAMSSDLVDDGISFSNIAATTTAFALRGGMYGVTAKASWGGGSATVQRLAVDGTSYVTCLTAITADGFSTAYLPAGTYKVAIATATAAYIDIVEIPGR